MTDEEWWDSMMEAGRWEAEFFEGNTSARKYQLYAAAWCRRIWDLFPHNCCRQAVETLERVADGLCAESALEAAWESFEPMTGPDPYAGMSEAQSYVLSAVVTCLRDKESRLARMTEDYCRAAIEANLGVPATGENLPDLVEESYHLVCELSCNPSRPVSLNRAWLTPTVTNLATAAYEERSLPSGELDPARLTVLADALEDAGCREASILEHLRSPGPHVRGCWPLDLLLGRE